MSEILSLYECCALCPRECRVNRTEGAIGACRAGAVPRVAHSMLHRWEEPCLSGENGSGTVFFSGCPLGCVYCQNHEISRGYLGEPHDSAALAELFLSLEARGAHNINLVTATHHLPHIAEAIAAAKHRGLRVPIVYNTSGYESAESLHRLHGLVDIYLTDMRYASPKTAAKYSFAADYPMVSCVALRTMVDMVGAPVLDEQGMMQSGVIVRLLLLPGRLIEAKKILKEVYTAYGDGVYISLMSQYTPPARIGEKYPALARTVSPYEYASLVSYARSLGVTNAFVQEGSAASESFIPDFLGKKE